MRPGQFHDRNFLFADKYEPVTLDGHALASENLVFKVDCSGLLRQTHLAHVEVENVDGVVTRSRRVSL